MVSFGNSPFSQLPDGLVFRITSTGVLPIIDSAHLSAFAPYQIDEGKASFGIYRDFIRAQKAKNKIKALGFPKADIQAYYNRNEVSLDDAFVLLDPVDPSENLMPAPELSIEKRAELMGEVYFQIKMVAASDQQKDLIDKVLKEAAVFNKSTSRNTWVTGYFVDPQHAETLKLLFEQKGVEQILITAKNEKGEEVPLETALEVFKYLNAKDLARD